MVDGILSLDDGFTIHKELTKSAFLSAKKGEATIVVENPPFFSYKLPTIHIYGVPIILTLYFVDEEIKEIHLYPLWDGTAVTWDQQISAAMEEAKRHNDQLLQQILGPPPYIYDWGEIMSTLDQKSGFNQIIVRYNEPRY